MNMTPSTRSTGISRVRGQRLLLAGLASVLAMGVGWVAAQEAGPTAGNTASPTQVVSPQAANAQFMKAATLYREGTALQEQGRRTDAQAKYAEALAENNKVLQMDPRHTQAVLLQGVLEGLLAGSAGGRGSTTGPAVQPPGRAGNRVPLLGAQQISAIRIWELSPGDLQLRGRIERSVLEDYWQNVVMNQINTDRSERARNAFLGANFAEQVHRIKASQDRKYIDQVSLQSDPASMLAFRSTVHTYVLQSCATAECHGGDKGGNFRLATGTVTPELMYTNFYIMAMYVGKDGGKMIDRESPERSLFLQYSLPQANAALPHPRVETRRIANLADIRFRAMVDWIRTLALPRPNYGIVYELPGAAVTPATDPVREPAALPK